MAPGDGAGRFRLMSWPTLFTVPVLIALLGLGTWQVQRLNWKDALIGEREARLAAAPLAIAATVRMTAALAVRLYGRILDKIEENDYDVFTRRASVPLLRKLAAVPPVVLSAWLPIDDSGLVSVPPKGNSLV